MERSSYVKWLFRLSLIFVLLLVLYVIYLMKAVWLPVLSVISIALLPFILGAFFAYLLHPVVEKLHESGLHRAYAILLIYTLFFGGLGYGIYRGIPLLIHQLRDLAENAPLFTEQYKSWLYFIQKQTSTWPISIQDQLFERIQAFEHWLQNIVSLLAGNVMKFMNLLIYFAIVPFISFYFLKDITKVKKFFWSLTPQRWRESGKKFMSDLDQSLGGYIRGQFLVCIVIGTIAAFALWVLEMKYSLILGLIIGATNVIPFFGPVIGAIPAVIVASTISTKMIIYVVIIVFGLQFLEGNILSPLIVGKSLHMHPLFIMGALIVGGEVGGVLGLLIAVPILAILRVAIINIHVHFIEARTKLFEK